MVSISLPDDASEIVSLRSAQHEDYYLPGGAVTMEFRKGVTLTDPLQLLHA